MGTFILLIIIYLVFISLGLPDALLGTAWPLIHTEWGIPLESAGVISFIIVGGTVVSSLSSGFVVRHLGTGKVVFISCLMTGSALLGFGFSQSFLWLVLLAIPLGLGAGSVDAAVNNFVALNFKAHHMNWLHSFWGVGATLGPVIMSIYLGNALSWRGGYRTVAIIQLSLAVILFLSLPVWKKHRKTEPLKQTNDETKTSINILKTKGLSLSLAAFLFYCAVELSIGLWGASFLVAKHQLAPDTAAKWIAFYYGSITAGRFVSGFISFKMKNPSIIRMGIAAAFAGMILFFVPLSNEFLGLPFVLIGLGLAPVFPAMLHETPKSFGRNASQTIIGFQMAAAYVGSAVMPPLAGLVLNNIHMNLFPFLLIAGLSIFAFAFELSLKRINHNI